MAVTRVIEVGKGRPGRFQSGQTVLERMFLVETNSAADDATVVKAHASIPALGAAHPNSTATVREINPDQHEDDRKKWDVKVVYRTSALVTTNEESGGDDPTAWPADIAWSEFSLTRVLEQDKAGTPAKIQNSAGDPLPYETEELWPQVTISRYIATSGYNPATADTYRRTTNSAEIAVAGRTIAIGQGLLWSYAAPVEVVNGVRYVHETIIIRVKADTDKWALKLLDAGFYAKSGGAKYRIQIDGEPADTPQFLDGSGQWSLSNTPVYLSFTEFASVAWAGLSLPTTLAGT